MIKITSEACVNFYGLIAPCMGSRFVSRLLNSYYPTDMFVRSYHYFANISVRSAPTAPPNIAETKTTKLSDSFVCFFSKKDTMLLS
jgi:hypothetical protein